jgi:GMP synthase (glutamine-hydrolysing)
VTRKILLIDHPVGRRDDRASRILSERGFEVCWVSPGRGDRLPEPQTFQNYAAAVVFGGPESANDSEKTPYIADEIDWIGRWVSAERPYLGICLGAQLLARSLGAEVSRHPEGACEIGYVEIAPTALANGFLSDPLHVYQWHNEGFELPEGAELLATGPVFPNQAYRLGEKIYGVQFHPEVTPEVSRRWIVDAGHMLVEPGAHSAERQIADSKLHDAPIERWFDGFLDVWLGTEG